MPEPTTEEKRQKNIEYCRKYRAANRAKEATKKLERRYGLAPGQFEDMLDAQGFSCAICGAEDPAGRHGTFNVDHCHTTGVVRGLLCNDCNIGLGKFKDNTATLSRAISYLNTPRVRPAALSCKTMN